MECGAAAALQHQRIAPACATTGPRGGAAAGALTTLLEKWVRGTRRERLNERLLDWIAAQAGHGELTTSVCTGAFLLAERGLLDGKRATTHWASVEWMTSQYPRVQMTVMLYTLSLDEAWLVV